MEFDALKKIGYTLRFYRRAKGYTQVQMAEALDISTRNFQRLEMGTVEPKLETLIRMARFLEIPVSALIRQTDQHNLAVYSISSFRERAEFADLDQKTLRSNQDLKFARKIVKQDQLLIPTSHFEFRLDGTTVTLPEATAKLVGQQTNKSDILSWSITGSLVERWEYIFRHNLKSAVAENMYLCPKGIMTLQIFHHSIDPNPENPTSDAYVRDVSERHSLEMWLRNFQVAKAFL